MRALAAAAILLAYACLLVGCSNEAPTPKVVLVAGDAARGHLLMAQLECNRCHQGAGLTAAPAEKQCIQCHRDILDGKSRGPTPKVDARWHDRVAGLGDAPSLESVGARFRRGWVVGFLRHPHDLRPLLVPTMPRLPLTETDAEDIATYLVPEDDPRKEREVDDALLAAANPAMGRELLINKGCGSCHWMTGVTALGGTLLPVGVTVSEPSRAMSLAPDLRFTRDRMSARNLLRWVAGPAEVKADTLMPKIPLTDAEAKDIAAYILRTPLAPLPKVEAPTVPANLARPVSYDEVKSKVLQRTCWHCHSDPDLERGDTGPGNTGGFGFKPRGLDLATYEGVFAGTLDDDGQRRSVFAPMPDGTPRLVAAMLARHRELAGDETAGIRGMPLGLPALPMEDIQLVSTWIAEGRPR